jgi:hypothetical protein
VRFAVIHAVECRVVAELEDFVACLTLHAVLVEDLPIRDDLLDRVHALFADLTGWGCGQHDGRHNKHTRNTTQERRILKCWSFCIKI